MNPVILTVRGKTPEIDKSAYIAPSAAIIGEVKVEQNASIWFNVTIRGDVAPIKIGKETNVQDNTVIHGTYGKYGTTLENRVTIGHSVILHGCTVGEGTLVGMGSILMDGVKIGKNSLVGAGSLVTEHSEFPENSLILGRPAKLKRQLTNEELTQLQQSADNYLLYKSWY